MKNVCLEFLASSICTLCIIGLGYSQDLKPPATSSDVVLSAVRGHKSRIGVVVFQNNDKKLDGVEVEIIGSHSEYFGLICQVPKQIDKGEKIELSLLFQPHKEFIGIAYAELRLITDDLKQSFSLRGLSIRALEGKNEPPLADVLTTLGYQVNLGWTTLANHIRPELQGDEIDEQTFKKYTTGDVDIIPLARYSPPWSLPFGYYVNTNEKPKLHEVGRLSESQSYPEQQTLFPSVEEGQMHFDPGDMIFGLFTTSPTHVAYTQDKWNEELFKDHATHASRIYEAKDGQGQTIPNQYLICFEEASNGDYQDYVFLLKNVVPTK